MSALRALGTKFPLIKQIEHNATHSKVPLDELRTQIYKQRLEYYLRRYHDFQGKYAQAKVDAKALWENKLTKPDTWTYGDAATALVCGVQVVGAFCIGEALGRFSIIGYNTGDDHHH